MVQVPPPTVRTVDPDTMHTCGGPEVNDTGSPEVAVADKAAGSPTGTPALTTSGGGVKETVCGSSPVVTWKDCVTWVAAA
jgi:hypothetical protein